MFYIKHIVPARGNALAYKEIPPHVYALAAYLFFYFLLYTKKKIKKKLIVKHIDHYLKMIKINR
jgi:hypothetical protein